MSYWWSGSVAYIISPALESLAHEVDSNCAATYPADLSNSSNNDLIIGAYILAAKHLPMLLAALP